MGQKSNVVTLHKKKFFNLFNLQSKDLLYGSTFLTFLKKLFAQKRIFLVQSSLNVLGNQAVLCLRLFFRTVKVNAFKRNLKVSKNVLLKVRKPILSILYSKILSRLQTNLIHLTTVNLNKSYNKTLFLQLFLKFKRFHTLLFPRRFNFFIDFLKLTLLFSSSNVNLNFYLETVGEIFKILPKKRHNFFLSFIQQFFTLLISDFAINNNNIKGLKFMISGRILAKPRAKFKYFQIGKIPMQSLSLDIDFAKVHVYTMYGVFGFKIWTYR